MKPLKETVDAIIAQEWEMFHSVNEGAELAWCQNDYKTFDGMRRGQYEAWDEETCRSYLVDITFAAAEGRNLAEEKYIYMMRSTAPEEFALLSGRVRPIDCETNTLAEEITAKLIAQTAVLREQYPCVSATGRPLRSEADTENVTSVETYQRSELLTYSPKTLRALQNHLIACERDGVSLAKEIQQNSLKTYGFQTIDEAESYLRRRQEKQNG